MHINLSSSKVNQESSTNLIDLIKPFLPFIVIFLIIILLIFISMFLIQNIKQKPKRQRIFYIKKIEEKAVPKPLATVIKDDKIKSIEEKVDEILLKRK